MQKDGKRRDDAFAAPPVQRVKAVTGQLLSWRLVLTNRSKLPVGGARISVMLPDVPERKGSRAALCVRSSSALTVPICSCLWNDDFCGIAALDPLIR